MATGREIGPWHFSRAAELAHLAGQPASAQVKYLEKLVTVRFESMQARLYSCTANSENLANTLILVLLMTSTYLSQLFVHYFKDF